MKSIISKREFESMKKDLEIFEEKREKVIQQSRGIIQLSKQVIYAVHRDDIRKASELFIRLKKEALRLPRENYDTDINKVALQEYVEAASLFYYATKESIPTRKELKVETEHYLLGICDLAGELTRKAVKHVINGEFGRAEKIRQIVEGIYGLFLQFNLRNGELRKKSDQIKWSLSKLEDMAYSWSVTKGLKEDGRSKR